MKEEPLVKFERKGNVIIARYNSELPITLEVAKQMVRERKEFTKGKSAKIVLVLPKFTSIDKGGRDYFSSEKAKEGIEANALVTSSVLSRAIVNFFLKLSINDKDNIPHKVFDNEKEALDWIKDLDVN